MTMVSVPTPTGRVDIDPVQVKVAVLLEMFDGNRSDMARHFGVTRAQPARWLAGEDRPAPDVERKMVDLEWVWDRLASETDTDVARGWLRSHNAFLDTTPLAALRSGTAAEVVAAWDAEQAGSYA